MKKPGKIWVWADKSRSIYKISPVEYKRILNNKITNSNKIGHSNTPALINSHTVIRW